VAASAIPFLPVFRHTTHQITPEKCQTSNPNPHFFSRTEITKQFNSFQLIEKGTARVKGEKITDWGIRSHQGIPSGRFDYRGQCRYTLI
jgi:hypothetical protein